MRNVVALLLVLLLAAPAHAGNANMKTAGIICTIVGGGLLITGIILLGVGHEGAGPDPGSEFDAGVALTVLGLVGAGVGIPLWIIGAKGSGGQASLTPGLTGAVLRF
jgi:hypothetical protein